MFDWDAHLRDQLAHLIRMSSIPGFKHHAWFRANEMAREHPDFYGDMPAKLSVAMAEKKSETSGAS